MSDDNKNNDAWLAQCLQLDLSPQELDAVTITQSLLAAAVLVANKTLNRPSEQAIFEVFRAINYRAEHFVSTRASISPVKH